MAPGPGGGGGLGKEERVQVRGKTGVRGDDGKAGKWDSHRLPCRGERVCLGEWEAKLPPRTPPSSPTLWLHRDLHSCDPGNKLESPSYRVSSGLSSLEVDLHNLARSAPYDLF